MTDREILTVDLDRVSAAVLDSGSKHCTVFRALKNNLTQNYIYWTTVNH